MKKATIGEIRKTDSRIKVLFDTSAPGMGVDAPSVGHVIHITPPSNIESYLQEVGRAGRTGVPSRTTLYFNNSDIAANKEHVNEPMKAYYKLQESCLRNLILKYLGRSCLTQERCCCICDGTYSNVAGNLQRPVKPRVRALPSDKKTLLQACILSQLEKLDNSIKAKEVITLFDCRSPDNKDLADILSSAEKSPGNEVAWERGSTERKKDGRWLRETRVRGGWKICSAWSPLRPTASKMPAH